MNDEKVQTTLNNDGMDETAEEGVASLPSDQVPLLPQPSKASFMARKNWVIVGAFATIVVIAIVVGVSMGVTSNKKKGVQTGSSNQATLNKTDSNQSSGDDKGSSSPVTATPVHGSTSSPARLFTSDAYSFSDLLPIWHSWYICEYSASGLPPTDGSCPGQNDRVPPKTTFLIYDPLPTCNDKPHVRVCDSIPSDHWIIVNVFYGIYFFLDNDYNNLYDTPELMKTISEDKIKNVTVVFAKVDGEDIDVPRVATESISKWGVLDTAGCSSDASLVHGWSTFCDGYFLRLAPFTPGNHTIEFFTTDKSSDSCSGTKYELTVV